jgi:hypothetical protein
MSFLNKFWRLSAVALVAAVPFVAACSDDDGAAPPTQDPPPVTGTISGSVTSSADASAIVGALVGTSPATATALSDAAGNFVITNVPIPTNPTSYAVTASKDGFASASTSVSLSSTAPTATANLALGAGPAPTTMGDLNVLVTNRTGEPQSGADVSVADAAGAVAASGTTDANGFALFSALAEGAYSVSATKTISGFDFRASGGTNIVGGETSFLQLTLARDFGQSVFPNIDGEGVTLTDDADIFFVPVPGNDSDPTVDCNIIRSQHMFIAEVEDGTGTPVSGVKVQWDLNISTQAQCNAFFGPLRCNEFIPGNTGSVVDSDDPDLDPATARSGLNPAFNVDTRKAVTFTNDNDQTIAFNGQNVVVGTGQTWIIITSPVEGITDVIAATPDIPINDPECANSSGAPCDKEFGIKRWVNWDTRVAELSGWNFQSDPDDDVDSVFTDVADGATLTNILARTQAPCGSVVGSLGVAQASPCELVDNNFLLYTEVTRLRDDSPFQFNHGAVKLAVTDDVPDVEIFDGFAPNVRGTGILIDPLTPCDLQNDGLGPPGCDDEYDTAAGPLSNGFSASDDLGLGEWSSLPLISPLFAEGWVVFEVRLNPAVYFCDDVDFSGVCDPGNAGSPDSFSTAYQQLLDGNADNTNSFTVTFCDEFGEECDRIDFDKEWVASRVQIIKNIPGQTIETVDGKDVKHHTVQIGQSFSYTITVIHALVSSSRCRMTASACVTAARRSST